MTMALGRPDVPWSRTRGLFREREFDRAFPSSSFSSRPAPSFPTARPRTLRRTYVRGVQPLNLRANDAVKRGIKSTRVLSRLSRASLLRRSFVSLSRALSWVLATDYRQAQRIHARLIGSPLRVNRDRMNQRVRAVRA